MDVRATMDDTTTQPLELSPDSDGPTTSPSFSSASSTYTPRVSRTCVYPPTIIRIRDPDSSTAPSSLLQFSLHTVPLTLTRELHTILPTLPPTTPTQPLLLLPTFQYSPYPLTTFTPQTEAAKNALLESFTGFAKQLCLHLTSRGYFADYIDPCTGLPSLTRSGGVVYSEVDGASALLRYRVEQAGCCSIVLHPRWGSACYPASCVTNARVEAVLEGLDRVRRRWEVTEERKEEEEEEEERTERGKDEQQVIGSAKNENTGDMNVETSGSSQNEERQQRAAMYVQSGKIVEEEIKMEMENIKDGDTPRIVTISTVVSDTAW